MCKLLDMKLDMKDYRTKLKRELSNASNAKGNKAYKITHETRILNIGSCFSENIGQRLANYKFRITINPHGILFNPISIATSLTQLIENKQFRESDIFYHNHRWQSFDHHGHFAKADKNDCLNTINQSINQAYKQIQKLDYLILTFGTANVFEYIQTGRVVANCHKISNSEFLRKRLIINEIISAYKPIFKQLKSINPQLNIILTVSPVRYIRDGLVENQRSKAILLLAIDELVRCFDFVEYFPAYELVIDDLRDYRFYNEDMIHPSKVAIDYVWEYFTERYFDNKTMELNSKINKIGQAKKHIPINMQSEAYQIFLKKQISKIEQFQVNYSGVNWDDDFIFFKKRLKKQK